ncbi:MAG: hypothetical protein II234_02285 [Clostridia bacterium]|nr:hypothetical protein [Clostridia bacterium]
MDKNLIEKYKKEMLNMYSRAKTAIPVNATAVMPSPVIKESSSFVTSASFP